MEDTFADTWNDDGREDSSSHRLGGNGELSDAKCSELRSKRLVKRVNSQNPVVLKVKQLQRSRSCIKESFLQKIHVLDNWIPKHMVTIDEKYIRRCLELIRLSASEIAPRNVSLNLGWGEMGVLCDGMSPSKTGNESTCDSVRLHFDCPLASADESVVTSPAGQWIVGSIMGSKSMINILNSPLFRKYGAYEDDANFEKMSCSDVDGPVCNDFMNSPSVLGKFSYKEAQIDRRQKYKSEILHERPPSLSSTNSTSSDQTSSSPLSATVTRGMLQCTWEDGHPHFVFSLDDQKVVYIATMWKVEPLDDKSVDYTYLFHLKTASQKEHEIRDGESHLVGKMKVSTSFTLCPNKSKIMQREFVLFGGNENLLCMQTSSHDARKNKGLRKVAEVFRTGHSVKRRTTSRFSGSRTILENYFCEPFRDTDDCIDENHAANLLEDHLPANLELAAIIVKDHILEKRQEKSGGWGMKFLDKSSAKETRDSSESLQSSGCCARSKSECSTSLDILIPAGLHGGTRTRIDGPSSLVERWKSDGCCDCGGWDLGCPLTVLRSGPNNKEFSSEAEVQGEYKLIDLITQGSKKSAPPLRMVNVYDGLYFVHFQSSLSALQSLAIAVAFIHTQSPTLWPENVRQFK